MASKKAGRARRARTEYWIFERGVLLRADGRPIILKDRKTAERFIAEMGMDQNWRIKEGLAPIRETRGRKAKDDPGMRAAHLAWAMMEPGKRPTRFDDQRAFMERFRKPLTGNPKQKRKVVRAFIKQVRRLHEKTRANSSLGEARIDSLLSR